MFDAVSFQELLKILQRGLRTWPSCIVLPERRKILSVQHWIKKESSRADGQMVRVVFQKEIASV